MEKMNGTEEKVFHFLEPLLSDTDYKIYDIEYAKEGSQWFLRVFIDKENGIDLNDCEAVTDIINEPLDKLDPIKEAYYLEVSSPGIERRLKTKAHFEAAIGEKVFLKLFTKVENKKEWTGTLVAVDNTEVTLDVEGKEIAFPCDMIAKANISVF